MTGVLVAAAAAAGFARGAVAVRARQRTDAPSEEPAASRRSIVPASLAAVVGASLEVPEQPAHAIEVDIPDRIKENPFELIGMGDPSDSKEDKKEFYMKKQYKA